MHGLSKKQNHTEARFTKPSEIIHEGSDPNLSPELKHLGQDNLKQ